MFQKTPTTSLINCEKVSNRSTNANKADSSSGSHIEIKRAIFNKSPPTFAITDKNTLFHYTNRSISKIRQILLNSLQKQRLKRFRFSLRLKQKRLDS